MNIIDAHREDKARIIEALCNAFQYDPQTQYILWEKGNKQRKLRRLMAYAFEFGLANGKVEISEERNAVAIWKMRNSKNMTVHLILESLLFLMTYGLKGLKRISDMEERIAKFYPENINFKYLWILGTDPMEQGKGYGSAILSQALGQYEHDSVPIYLETSSESNARYYQKKQFSLYHSFLLDSELGLTIYLLKHDS